MWAELVARLDSIDESQRNMKRDLAKMKRDLAKVEILIAGIVASLEAKGLFADVKGGGMMPDWRLATQRGMLHEWRPAHPL